MTKLAFEALVSGFVNGATVSVRGSGTIDEEAGRTVGAYDIRGLPDFYDPGLLTACILTGYPNATATPQGTPNPFQGRSYGYERRLDFRSGECLTYTADCRIEGGRLLSHFRLDGAVPIVRLPTRFVQLIEETWTTDAQQRLRGTFTAPWEGRGSDVAPCADAQSDYRFDLSDDLQAVRQLRLQANTRGHVFKLVQESKLSG